MRIHMRHSDNASFKTIIRAPSVNLKAFVKRYGQTLNPNFLKKAKILS